MGVYCSKAPVHVDLKCCTGVLFYSQMTLNMDIDRLHRVSLGEDTGPGAGKTYAGLQDMLAAFELGEELIVLLIPEMKLSRWLSREMQKVCQERGYTLKRQRINEYSINEQCRVLLLPDFGLDRKLMGLNAAIVDLRHS